MVITHRHPRNTATRRFSEHLRRAALLSHAVQHTAHAEHVGVNRRQRSRQDHEVKNTGREGNAQMLEGQDEGLPSVPT